ncbi:MAG: DUF72 domain-containing protein [Cyclobacteriaceae bacterium]
MKFGAVEDPSLVDFVLPEDHPGTERILTTQSSGEAFEAYVGCSKWNRADLKHFYPRGTKDDLAYYARQFNCIEHNATFHRNYGPDQMEKWASKVPDNFKFFPKVSRYISHLKRLKEVEVYVDEHCHNISHFGDKLEMAFIQLHDNFAPKDRDRVKAFIEAWYVNIPLAIELRNTHWFHDEEVSEWLYDLLEKHHVANVITDTAGRRDLLHMRLTTSEAFVRFVGANHESDYSRMEDWIDRIQTWKAMGLNKLYFFVHQNLEKASPYLADYFISRLNEEFDLQLKRPKLLEEYENSRLF